MKPAVKIPARGWSRDRAGAVTSRLQKEKALLPSTSAPSAGPGARGCSGEPKTSRAEAEMRWEEHLDSSLQPLLRPALVSAPWFPSSISPGVPGWEC